MNVRETDLKMLRDFVGTLEALSELSAENICTSAQYENVGRDIEEMKDLVRNIEDRYWNFDDSNLDRLIQKFHKLSDSIIDGMDGFMETLPH